MSHQSKFTVAICGGGIAGLTTALALTHFSKERHDIKLDVYEAATQFTEIGAGIGFWPRPWNILKKLGCTDDLERLLENQPKEGELVKSIELRKSDFKEGHTFYEVITPTNVRAFHRAKVLDVLASHANPDFVTTHFSKRLVSYSLPEGPDGKIQLNFKDGSTADADVLIGCDGIHSVVRHTLLNAMAEKLEAAKDGDGDKLKQADHLRNSVEAKWTGTTCYRAVIPRTKIEALNPNHHSFSRPTGYCGKNKHIVANPISRGAFINVAAFVSWPEKAGTTYEGKMVEETNEEVLMQHFAGWEDEVQQLLQCMKRPLSWVINEVSDLPLYAFGQVAILGDAAHAMAPHQGSGAGQAIEDAHILAVLLSHPKTTIHTLKEALKVYEDIRRPFAADIQKRSAFAGTMYDFIAPECLQLQDVGKSGVIEEEDFGKLWNIGHLCCDCWRWAWTTGIAGEEEKAIEMLESRLAKI